MPAMVKAVIFDVDGTLVDSVDQHAHAWQDAFAEFGHSIEFAKLRTQIGKGGDQLLPVFLSDGDVKRIGPPLESRRKELLQERYLPTIKGFPEVRSLFKRLEQAGIRIALASSAKGDELSHYKRLADIEDLVQEQTSSDDADRSKPEPDIFQAALARLGDIDPATAVVVGDTPYDAIAAAKAGLRAVGLLCGGFAEADLREAGCIEIYADPAALLAAFSRSVLASPAQG